MIKVSIFSFPIFGKFNELLANSVLFAAYIDAASKKSFTSRVLNAGSNYPFTAFIYAASNYLLHI